MPEPSRDFGAGVGARLGEAYGAVLGDLPRLVRTHATAVAMLLAGNMMVVFGVFGAVGLALILAGSGATVFGAMRRETGSPEPRDLPRRFALAYLLFAGCGVLGSVCGAAGGGLLVAIVAAFVDTPLIVVLAYVGIGFGGIAGYVYATVRLSPLLATAARGDPISVRDAWRASGAKTGRLAAIFLGAMLPAACVGLVVFWITAPQTLSDVALSRVANAVWGTVGGLVSNAVFGLALSRETGNGSPSEVTGSHAAGSL